MLGALPGIREIRSALAGGYLWIAFLWLVFDPFLGETNFESGPYESAHHLGDALGPVALSIAATFAAYLIGTFFNELRGAVGRLYLRARQSASTPSAVRERAEIVDQIEQRNKMLQAHFRERFEALISPGSSAGEDTSSRGSGTSREQVQRLLASTEKLLGLLVTLPGGLARLSVNVTLKWFEWNQRLVLWFFRFISGSRMEPYKPFLSNQGVVAVERYIGTRGGSLPDSVELDVADVIADFPVIRTRLLHQSPDTVSEYDRLRAEADFRSAIVPPLMAIFTLFAFKVSYWWVLVLPLLLVLLLTARTRRREAGDILADTLGVVEAPSAEAQKGSSQTIQVDPALTDGGSRAPS